MKYPEIESGIPMPVKTVDGRSDKKGQTWARLLRGMDVGDSFEVNLSQASSLRLLARAMDFDLVWRERWERGARTKVRIWLYGKPGNRTPIRGKDEQELSRGEEMPPVREG